MSEVELPGEVIGAGSEVFDPEYWGQARTFDFQPIQDTKVPARVAAEAKLQLKFVLPRVLGGSVSGSRISPGVTMDIYDPEAWQHASHLYPGSILLVDYENIGIRTPPGDVWAAGLHARNPDVADPGRHRLSPRELMAQDLLETPDGSTIFDRGGAMFMKNDEYMYRRVARVVYMAHKKDRQGERMVYNAVDDALLDANGNVQLMTLDYPNYMASTRTVGETWQHASVAGQPLRGLQRMRSVEVLQGGQKLPVKQATYAGSLVTRLLHGTN